MKLIQKIGLGLFVACFLVFIITLTLSSYQINNNTLKATYDPDDNRPLLMEGLIHAANELHILNKTYKSQFAFNAVIPTLFETSNQYIRDKITKDKGVSASETEHLLHLALESGKVVYSKDVLIQTFKNQEGKINELDKRTSWMYGRAYDSENNFKNDITAKIDEINNDFSKEYMLYANSYERFKLTKKATTSSFRKMAVPLAIISFIISCFGALLYIYPQKFEGNPGIKNNGIFHHPATNRGWIGISVGTFLILFYILLYWFPYYITNWTIMLDPLSKSLSGNEASEWFLYGTLYCVAMIVMGVRMAIKYRHNRYQLVRTASVVFFQLSFAFIIPEILVRFQYPYYDFKNSFPLDYDFIWNGYGLFNYQDGGGFTINGGKLGVFMAFWGIALFIIIVPLFVYLYGKRWYCSWVCGCGGLAETLGDPYRQLSDKSMKAWKIERWMIHSVLAFSLIMTALTVTTMFSGNWNPMGISTYNIQKTYGFLIGSAFAGVVGTGFYPFMGNRVWCRFGCPLAAYMGLVQRFKSRFRITTNGGQCISCGNCSTYCEQGIDVRSYAQKGQNIVRASCVGCGICSAVCPRGVLKLENGPDIDRTEVAPIVLGNNNIDIIDLPSVKKD